MKPNHEALGDKVAEVLAGIEAAFGKVRLGDGIGLREAEVVDDWGEDPDLYRSHEQRAAARAIDLATPRWQDIPADQIRNQCGHNALNFTNPEGYRFLLPAFMRWTVHQFGEGEESPDHDSAVYSLGPSIPDLAAWQLARWNFLSDERSVAVLAFLDFLVEAYDAMGDDLSARDARVAIEGHWKRFR